MTRELLQQLIDAMHEDNVIYPSDALIEAIRAELAKPTQQERNSDLETVRAAFRAATLADGGIESFDDVGPELVWQVAELRNEARVKLLEESRKA